MGSLASLAGTAQGAQVATALALMSAFAHASFGALQKGRHDPWLSRGAIDLWLVVLSFPAVLWAGTPDAGLALILAGAVVIHFAYKLTMALAYDRAAYTVVYPVVRGTGPLVTLGAAAMVFGETYGPLQWLGVLCLSGGILMLARLNLARAGLGLGAIRAGLAWAAASGVLVAVYTAWDAYGIRTAATPFNFLAWFFFVTAFDFTIVGVARYRRMPAPPAPLPLLGRGLAGALIAYVSFGGVMVATYLDKVGEAAVLRETSTVFAALIGWAVLGEAVGPRRSLLMALIALGAVLVELGR